MVAMERIRVEWTGLTGLPGVSTFYAEPTVPTAYAAVHGFFTGIRDFFPSTLTWTFPAFGDVVDDSNGALVGTWSTTPQASVTGAGPSTVHAAGVGCRVRWNTNGVSSSNRSLRGSSFLTALVSAYFDADGTINSTALSTIQTEANDMVSSADFRIWTRPIGGSG